MVEQGFGDHTALIGNGRRRTYKELSDWTNRLAHALVENYGVKPGNRVLIRSANNPAMVACWLAATKAGAVVVNTMPMLRAGELAKIVDKAEIALALCDTRLMDELVACAKDSRFLKQVIGFDGTANHDAELDRIALDKPVHFDAVQTGRDDVALLGFTSGTTGEPKATMHFHRDLLIIADGYAKEVLSVTPDDVFVGSPPLAFTFGLGGLAIFPLRFGAAATLLENASPRQHGRDHRDLQGDDLLHRADRLSRHAGGDGPRAPTCRRCALPSRPARRCRRRSSRNGRRRPASRSSTASASTEMLHIFISNRFGDAAARRAPAGRSPATRRGSSTTTMHEVPRGDDRPARGARPDRLPLPRRPAPEQLCARRLEPDRRHFRAGRGRPLPFRRARRRHDHLGGLQHRRTRSRGGAAGASRCRRMRGHRRPRRASAARSSRRMSCWRQGVAATTRCVEAPAGPRQGDDRALQISALGQIHRRACPRPQTGKIQRFRLRQGNA